MTESIPTHPLGKRARILLTSVFGPYARDDAYGSRAINPMELYHNQVTREQGPFSLRMFHRTFGLLLIEANIDAPCAVLDFPPLDRFEEEISENTYDIVGISAIPSNVAKVRKMCELVRRHLPGAAIVVGGHIANVEDLAESIDVDHIVRGDGVQWFRNYLSQDAQGPIRHPAVLSGFGTRILGMNIPGKPGDTAAIVVPSVGCPMGCNFCATSALFGGKGKFVNFYETGDELFDVLCGLEEQLKARSFFVLDENFLLHKQRALRLLELMERHDKAWSFYVFSSARAIETYTMDQLVAMGISWVWMGLEGRDSRYAKLKGIDTFDLVRRLKSHGISVLGSTIIGLEDHRPETMDEVIAHATAHAADFHQFMLYTPVPGTPFYEAQRRAGVLLSRDEFSPADAHGQYRFNYRHAHIPAGTETEMLRRAFRRDFEVNGPSLARLIETRLQGWLRHGHHEDPRIRKRFAAESEGLGTRLAAAVWAMRRWYRKDERMGSRLDALLRALYGEFGPKSRAMAPVLGAVMLFCARREQARLLRGWTYEPAPVCEKNSRLRAMENDPPVEAPFSAETQEALLSMRTRRASGASSPLVVDLKGVFNMVSALRLKDRIESHLAREVPVLALNFRGVTAIDRDALFEFLEKLKGYGDRIKIIRIETFREEMDDVVRYAQGCFDVLTDEAGLCEGRA